MKDEHDGNCNVMDLETCKLQQGKEQTARGVQFGGAISHVRWSTASSSSSSRRLARFNSSSMMAAPGRRPAPAASARPYRPASIGAHRWPQGHARSAAAGPGTKHGIPPPHDADPTPPPTTRAA
jgi:hypothetical protein